MARTLYLNDGSTEIVIGDQEEVLGRIIEERLGRDCKELFDDIKEEWIEEPWDTNGKEDYERIADGFRAIAVSAMNALHEVIMQPRLTGRAENNHLFQKGGEK